MVNHIYKFAALAFLGGVASVSSAEPPAPVARLAQIEGKVMVNMGTTYAMASPGTLVLSGAKVVTTRGSSVALVYKDGCIKRLKENSILTVGLATECTANKTSERVYLAEAVGGNNNKTDAPSPAGSAGGDAGGINSGFIVGGFVAAGVVVELTRNNNNNNNNNNASAQ